MDPIIIRTIVSRIKSNKQGLSKYSYFQSKRNKKEDRCRISQVKLIMLLIRSGGVDSSLHELYKYHALKSTPSCGL